MTWSSESKLGPHTMRTSVCVGENVTKDGTCETAQRHSNEKRDETPWHLDNKGKSLRARMGGGGGNRASATLCKGCHTCICDNSSNVPDN